MKPELNRSRPSSVELPSLDFEFQPIADIGGASVFGYEALMRGPVGSPLRSPEELLRLAKREGRMVELEQRACCGAIAAFGALGLPGRLFLNASAPAIEELARDGGATLLKAATAAGLIPSRLVLELTEHERVENVGALQRAMEVLGAHGVAFAIDDFGDGRSSLRLWVQLKPQLVKLDRFFVHGLQGDARKVEVIRALVRLAEVLGTPLIAEGIEDTGQLAVLRDLGCQYAQGYCIGRPSANPKAVLSDAVAAVLNSPRIAVIPTGSPRSVGCSVERLRVEVPSVPPDLPCGEALRIFNANPRLHAISVVRDGRPEPHANARAGLIV